MFPEEGLFITFPVSWHFVRTHADTHMQTHTHRHTHCIHSKSCMEACDWLRSQSVKCVSVCVCVCVCAYVCVRACACVRACRLSSESRTGAEVADVLELWRISAVSRAEIGQRRFDLWAHVSVSSDEVQMCSGSGLYAFLLSFPRLPLLLTSGSHRKCSRFLALKGTCLCNHLQMERLTRTHSHTRTHARTRTRTHTHAALHLSLLKTLYWLWLVYAS